MMPVNIQPGGLGTFVVSLWPIRLMHTQTDRQIYKFGRETDRKIRIPAKKKANID